MFIVDDVAFIQAKHGFEIGEAIARRGIRKQYYLETRGDVLLRNREVFEFWTTPRAPVHVPRHRGDRRGGLRKHRKRVSLGENLRGRSSSRALARHHGRDQPDRRSRLGRRSGSRWSASGALEIPEIVNIYGQHALSGHRDLAHRGSPRPRRATTASYDIQHAVLPTQLPLPEFYAELIQDPAGARHQASRVCRVRAVLVSTVAGRARARTDELRPEPLEVQLRCTTRR